MTQKIPENYEELQQLKGMDRVMAESKLEQIRLIRRKIIRRIKKHECTAINYSRKQIRRIENE